MSLSGGDDDWGVCGGGVRMAGNGGWFSGKALKAGVEMRSVVGVTGVVGADGFDGQVGKEILRLAWRMGVGGSRDEIELGRKVILKEEEVNR